eukprot:245329_1
MATHKSEDTLTCWSVGSNQYGQQGVLRPNKIDKLNIVPLPTNVHHIHNIVSCKNGSTYISYNNNQLIVCGYNEFGQLGISIHIVILYWMRMHLPFMSDQIPTDVIHLIGVFFGDKIYDDNIHRPIQLFDIRAVYIAPGINSSHRFIITDDHKLYGAGNNDAQQLTFASPGNEVYCFTRIHYFDDVKLKSIHCGYSFSTFLTQNGEIYTAGSSCRGFRRNNKYDTSVSKVPMNKSKIIDICCGSDHTLALSECGTVQTWGYNMHCQLGHGHTNPCHSPGVIQSLKACSIVITTIASGGWHNVLLCNKGTMYCFGRNDMFQCGDGDESNDLIGIRKYKLNVMNIKCGLNHNVAKTKQNEYLLWGDNALKQCLVFKNAKFVKTPTKFPNKMSKAFTIESIYPGYKETKVITKKLDNA